MTADPGTWMSLADFQQHLFEVGPWIGEGTPLTLSENERISNKRSNFDTDSDKESIGGGIGLQKSKVKAKKKRFKNTGLKSWKGMSRKATVLVSKKIVKEAKLRNMSLSDYIKQ